MDKFDLNRKEIIQRKRHHVEEQDEGFDPATVTGGETKISKKHFQPNPENL